MGIVIHGMKMPKDESDFVKLVIFNDGRCFVAVGDDEITSKTGIVTATEFPPHGRLGDLDKISNLLKDRIAENDKWILEFCAHGDSKSVNELYDENAILERVISLLKYDSRTIIPAEEET